MLPLDKLVKHPVWAARTSAMPGGGGGGCCDPLPLAFTKPSGLPHVDPTIWNMQKLFFEQVVYNAPKYKRVNAEK